MEATSPGTTEEDAEADNMQNKNLSAEDTNVQNVQSTDKIEVCTESDKTMASLQAPLDPAASPLEAQEIQRQIDKTACQLQAEVQDLEHRHLIAVNEILCQTREKILGILQYSSAETEGAPQEETEQEKNKEEKHIVAEVAEVEEKHKETREVKGAGGKVEGEMTNDEVKKEQTPQEQTEQEKEKEEEEIVAEAEEDHKETRDIERPRSMVQEEMTIYEDHKADTAEAGATGYLSADTKKNNDGESTNRHVSTSAQTNISGLVHTDKNGKSIFFQNCFPVPVCKQNPERCKCNVCFAMIIQT